MPQPMQNLEDNSDPTTAMNKALALIAKAFKLNTIPTNNNQRSSLIPRNSQIVQPDINMSQDIKMKMVDDNVGNHVKQNDIQNDRNEQASIFGTQSDKAPVYDSDGSAKVHVFENCYDNDIFNMLTHELRYTDLQTEVDDTKEKLENCIIKKEKEYAVLWNNWYTKCEECKYDNILYDKAYNDMQQKIKRLQAQLGDLKGKSSDTKCASNTPDLLLEDEN
nr:hypothetical protein [Tanacetum cinerariifolium]